MKKKLSKFFCLAFFIFLIFGCAPSDDGGSSVKGTIEQPSDEGDTDYGNDDGEIVITDVLTDADGTSSGSATLETGEEIIVTGIGEDAVTSTKISKSSSIDYNEANYSAVTDYSLKVNPEDEVSVKIKFKETPNAVMAKDNVTSKISYKPFLNNEDGSSHFNMKAGEDVSFFALKNKSSSSSSMRIAPLSLSSSSSSESFPRRVIIQKDGKNISITFDASLNVGIAVLDGSVYGGSTKTENVVDNFVTFTDLSNGTYRLTAYELWSESAKWEQDIFIENREVSEAVVSALAEKFAPILAMNGEEDYFPTSLETIFQNSSSGAPDLHFKLASIKGGDDVAYSDLIEYLATNGHAGAYHKVQSEFELYPFFKDISGDTDKTVYYSFIQKYDNYYMTFHFLYAFDPKGTKEKPGLGNHVFDRESITLVFEDVTTNRYVGDFGKPNAVVFGAHLGNQIIKYNGDVEPSWKGGRAYIPWESVKKSDTHPIVPVALGSHALYPLCGEYAVYVYGVGKNENACGNDLSSTKLLLPEPIHEESLGDSYNLFDLRIGDLDSYSDDAFKALMFSGELIDVFLDSAKFPPFTDGNREIDPEAWASFDIDNPMNEEKAFYWYIAEVDSPLTDAIVEKLDNFSEFVTGKIPDTGQTTSYTLTFGEDSDYTINPPSYTDNGNGTVTDNVTGLIWQKEDDNVFRTWSAAVSYCENLSLGGYSSWKLPNQRDLLSIVDYGRSHPSINSIFSGTESTYYWSSNYYYDNPDEAWGVDFSNGFGVYWDKYSVLPVRCVLNNLHETNFNLSGDTVVDSSTGLMWQRSTFVIVVTWAEALSYCEDNLTLEGYNDWRLPNIMELASFVDYSTEYAYPLYLFSGYPGTTLWSSTVSVNSTSYAWVLSSLRGLIGRVNRTEGAIVRCVRGGQ